MDVAMYLRKSRQEEEADTVEETLARHRYALDEYARQHKLNVLEVYEEVVSGGSLYARPQMLRLLADVEKGKYDAVLCMDIDRLGRGSMSDQGCILETLKAEKTKIITPRKTYDLNNDLDETYSEFETFMARQELKTISRRLHRGLQKTIQDGGYVANAPYGYHKTQIDKRPTLEIYEPEAQFVRMMFDWYANERIGCQTIANRLNQMGSAPHRAVSWGRTSVMRILRSPVYDGKIVWDRVTHIRKGKRGNQKHLQIYNPRDKWTVVDGLHPAMIDHELYQQVQDIFASRYHTPSFDGTIVNPLAGVVLCAHCGAPMQRVICNGGEYLVCVKAGCMVSSRLAAVEDAILGGLADSMDSLESKRKEATEIPMDEAIVKSISTEKKTAENQLSKLHDLLEQGVYNAETFLCRRDALQTRITALNEQLSKYGAPPKKVDYAAEIAVIRNVLDVYKDSDAGIRNTMLKSIINKAVYDRPARSADFTVDIELIPTYQG